MRSSYNMIVGVDFIRLGLRRILGILDSIFGGAVRVCNVFYLNRIQNGLRRTNKDQEGLTRFRQEHTRSQYYSSSDSLFPPLTLSLSNTC
jgi:hypothetical protein